MTERHGPGCEICRDLDDSHFKYKEGGGDIALSSAIRFHYVEFDELRESASRGCKLCRILQQGTSFFWGKDPARPFETIEGQLKDVEQSEMRKKSNDRSKSEDRRKPEELVYGEQSGNVMRIEIRPKQSLLVTRITYISANGRLSDGMRAPLEFYTKLGNYYTFEWDSFGINAS